MKVLILTATDPNKSKVSGGVRTFNLNLQRIITRLGYDYCFYETREIKKLLTFSQKAYQNYDIVFINISIYDKGFLKLIYELVKIKNKKTIVQGHGGSFGALKFKFFYKILFSRILNKKVNKFLVLNDAQKNSLSEIFQVNKRKIWKVPNFIENDFDLQNKTYDGKTKFIYIGRIVKVKGVIDFAKAFMEINNDDIEYHIIGDGPKTNDIIHFSNIDRRIIYHGELFGNEKKKKLQECHVLVFLTEHSEGFPISVLEALNFGMAILSTPFSSQDELIYPKYNGLITTKSKANIKNCINFFLENNLVVKQYGENSKKLLSENFDLNIQGLHMYRKIFSK